MYSIFDITLDSDIPLRELPKISMSNAGICIRIGSLGNEGRYQPQWLHHWHDPTGAISISCGRVGDDYLLRFPELADFLVSSTGNSVLYLPQPDIPVETIRHLLLDQVVPRILGQQGRLVLHASAIVLKNGKAVAFLGASGRGKSTIASSFHESGFRLITDDCLLIERVEGTVLGIPNYYGLRLFEDSARAIFNGQHEFSDVAHYTSKKRLILRHLSATALTQSVPLQAIFLLGEPEVNTHSDDISIIAVEGAGELIALLEQTFFLDVTDKHLMARRFNNAGKIIAANPTIYRLNYPRDYTRLNDVREKVEAALRANQ